MFVLVKWIDEDEHSIVAGSQLDKCAALVQPGDEVGVKVFEGTKTKMYRAEVIDNGKHCLIRLNTCLKATVILFLVLLVFEGGYFY